MFVAGAAKSRADRVGHMVRHLARDHPNPALAPLALNPLHRPLEPRGEASRGFVSYLGSFQSIHCRRRLNESSPFFPRPGLLHFPDPAAPSEGRGGVELAPSGPSNRVLLQRPVSDELTAPEVETLTWLLSETFHPEGSGSNASCSAKPVRFSKWGPG